MKKTISPRDLELLSEYLDGRLDASGRAKLEARLKSNAELAETLHDLSQTRAMLRSLPRRKAPRSFKLTPQIAGQMPSKRAAPRLYPAFQFASVLASLLLVLVLAGDFLGVGARGSAPLTAPQAPSVALSAPTTEPTLQAFSAPAESQSKIAAATPAPPQDLTSPGPLASTQAPLPTHQIARSAANNVQTALPGAPAMAGTSSTPAAPLVGSSNPAATEQAYTLQQPETNLASGAAPAASPTVQAVPAEAAHKPAFPLPPIRIGEIVLALVALSTGLAAFLLRRA